jgi:hypothetical protein
MELLTRNPAGLQWQQFGEQPDSAVKRTRVNRFYSSEIDPKATSDLSTTEAKVGRGVEY